MSVEGKEEVVISNQVEEDMEGLSSSDDDVDAEMHKLIEIQTQVETN